VRTAGAGIVEASVNIVAIYDRSVTVILGPAGTNLGAGMTASCLLCPIRSGPRLYQQSVRLAPIEVREELWLRRVLRKHFCLTDSPRAAHILTAGRPLLFCALTAAAALLCC